MLRPNIIKAIKAAIPVGDDIAALIHMANSDLYNGSLSVGDEDDDGVCYPGFSKACDAIRDALPTGDYWVNVETDHARDSEPEWHMECPAPGCCGGFIEYTDDPDDGYDGEPCTECNGTGAVECEIASDWMQVSARDVRAAIVGSELAAYL